MRTNGQRIEGRVVTVPSGQVRHTICGFIECKDRFGMPFGWHESLVRLVESENGLPLWRK
jgi:hypothetical protein